MHTDTVHILATIVTSFAPMGKEYVGREGLVYAPFMAYGLPSFQEAVTMLVDTGHMVRLPHHGLSITDKGIALAAVIEAERAKHAAANPPAPVSGASF